MLKLKNKPYTSNESKDFENNIKEGVITALSVLQKMDDRFIYRQSFVIKNKITNKKIKTVVPDAGIIYYNDIPLFATEAKYQNERGNACERLGDLKDSLRHENIDTMCVFVTGNGLFDKNKINENHKLYKTFIVESYDRKSRTYNINNKTPLPDVCNIYMIPIEIALNNKLCKKHVKGIIMDISYLMLNSIGVLKSA